MRCWQAGSDAAASGELFWSGHGEGRTGWVEERNRREEVYWRTFTLTWGKEMTVTFS